MLTPISWFCGDLDSVGESLDSCAATNDLVRLLQYSELITATVASMAEWIRSHKGIVHLAIADELIFQAPTDLDWSAAPISDTNWTWSFGAGSSLAEAHAALAIAKRRGGKLIVSVSPGAIDEILYITQ